MTIQEIKSHLSIETVLSHYQLKPDLNGMLCCPFHNDKKASMKIYDKTNTAYCFAGSCEVESVDVIDFILKMDKCTKREAILKAKDLIGTLPQNGQAKLPLEIEARVPIERAENYNKVFTKYIKALETHQEAKAYCEERALNPKLIEVGYKSRKTRERWGRGCLIFPLKDIYGDVVSLYGRGITGSSHFYKAHRSGLYPCYLKKTTNVIVLLESVIDAAILLAIDLPLNNYALLAMYGTNGLTGEHTKAIIQLSDLQEIIFALDGDEAGGEAVKEYSRTLGRLCPQVRISSLCLP